MAWSYDQQKRLEQIRELSFAELIHLMITEHDGDKESNHPVSQSFDYFRAAEELDRRWKELSNGRS